MVAEYHLSGYDSFGEDGSQVGDWDISPFPPSQPCLDEDYEMRLSPALVPSQKSHRSGLVNSHNRSGSAISRNQTGFPASATAVPHSRVSHASDDNKSQSLISISSDDPHDNKNELIIAHLQHRINQLEKERDTLDGHLNKMSYVFLILYHTDYTHNYISDAYFRLVNSINKIDTNVKEMRGDVKNLASRIKTTSTNSTNGTKATASRPGREQYKILKYWYKGPWLEIKSKAKAKDLDENSPIISLYMEDALGRPISDEVKNMVRGDLTAYWNEFSRLGETLYNFKDLGYTRQEHFRDTFEAKYPWLRLCEARWKVDYLWINYFGSWKKSHCSSPSPPPTKKITPGKPIPDSDLTNPRTVPVPNNDQEDPIDISSDTANSPVTTTMKRPRKEEDINANAPKKQKGKEGAVDIMAPTIFHHSRPKPRKTHQANLADVSALPTILVRYKLNAPNRIHCIRFSCRDRFG